MFRSVAGLKSLESKYVVSTAQIKTLHLIIKCVMYVSAIKLLLMVCSCVCLVVAIRVASVKLINCSDKRTTNRNACAQTD